MLTYIILNLIFMTVVILLLGKYKKISIKHLAITLVVLVILTTVFDNLIIGLSIVDYDPTKLSGIYVVMAPIEDFMYTVLVVILVPALWNKLGEGSGNE